MLATLTDRREPHKNVSRANSVLNLWREKRLVKMAFTEHNVTVMDEEGTSSGSKESDGSICSLKERKLA